MTVEHLLDMAPFLIGCIITLALHELAHIATARALGVRVKKVGINWRGPFIVREPGNTRANACIALSGPIANLILAALFWTAMPGFAHLNIALGLSNLLPLQGSDGSRALMALRQLKASAGLPVASK